MLNPLKHISVIVHLIGLGLVALTIANLKYEWQLKTHVFILGSIVMFIVGSLTWKWSRRIK